jgi:hypothetical protein
MASAIIDAYWLRFCPVKLRNHFPTSFALHSQFPSDSIACSQSPATRRRATLSRQCGGSIGRIFWAGQAGLICTRWIRAKSGG